jgi:hypothetical protein
MILLFYYVNSNCVFSLGLLFEEAHWVKFQLAIRVLNLQNLEWVVVVFL